MKLNQFAVYRVDQQTAGKALWHLPYQEARQQNVSITVENYRVISIHEMQEEEKVADIWKRTKNQCEVSDVLELFLWPEGKAHYWEIYAAPNGRRSMLFFPGAGRKIFLTAMQEHTRLRAGARVDGTLNDWSDRDRGWTAEIAIPLEELTRYGDPFGASGNWRAMAARYNYSVTLPEIEYSATSPLPKTDFHLREAYGKLVFPERIEHK